MPLVGLSPLFQVIPFSALVMQRGSGTFFPADHLKCIIVCDNKFRKNICGMIATREPKDSLISPVPFQQSLYHSVYEKLLCGQHRFILASCVWAIENNIGSDGRARRQPGGNSTSRGMLRILSQSAAKSWWNPRA